MTDTVDGEASSTMTQEGGVLGTPDYLAPEQTLDAHNVDIRADLYSLGCTFYFLLTGQVPFPGGSMGEKLMRHQLREPRPLEELRRDVPGEVAAVVRKLMAKRPQDRYQTPAELAEALVHLPSPLWGEGSGVRGRADSSSATLASTPPKQVGIPDGNAATEDLPGVLPRGTEVLHEAAEARRATLQGGDRRPWYIAGGVAAVLILALVAFFVFRSPRQDRPHVQPHVQAPPAKVIPAPPVKPLPPGPPPVDDAWIKHVQSMPADKQVEAVAKKLQELNPGFDGKVTPTIEKDVVIGLEFSTDQVSDISPVRGLTGLQRLNCAGTRSGEKGRGSLFDLTPLKGLTLTHLVCTNNAELSDLSPLQGMGLRVLECGFTKVSNLGPLQRMPLAVLNLWAAPISDLSPLKGLPLKNLSCGGSQVADLSPLQGMSLENLACGFTNVSDLAPLRGMPLKSLYCAVSKVRDLTPIAESPIEQLLINGIPAPDLSPLKKLKLRQLHLTYQRWRGDRDVLRSIPTLTHISLSVEHTKLKPVAEFWKEVDAEEAAFDAWCAGVTKMPPEKQVEAVAAELKKRNPGFDGKISAYMDGGLTVVLNPSDVSDISPLRAFADMRKLVCRGSAAAKAKLADLWPLRGMLLKQLDVSRTSVAELTPLMDMPLQKLSADSTPVADLTPLKKLPLTYLTCNGSAVSDLTALEGTKLEHLDFGNTKVSDIVSLRGLPLTFFHAGGTPVVDLSPLKEMSLTFCWVGGNVTDLTPLTGMPLKYLNIRPSRVADLSPVRDAPIETLSADINIWRDQSVLRSLRSLKEINSKPAAEFWKPYDDFDAWVKEVAKLPAEKQVEAVAAELVKRNPGFDGKVTPKIENDTVTSLQITSDAVHDLAPVRALKELRDLDCAATEWGKGKLTDLWPLHGLGIERLYVRGMPVTDLNPLRGTRLKTLQFVYAKVVDLAPLKEIATLTSLDCSNTSGIVDLAPIEGLPLQSLNCAATKITSLEPLRGMKLRQLWIGGTQVTDLTPIRGMPLAYFSCDKTRIADLSVIEGMPIQNLHADIQRWRDESVLRSLKALKTVNSKPAAEFWKPHDDFDAWCKQVAKLPAEKQVEAVAAELKKRNPGFDGKMKPTIEGNVVVGVEFMSKEVSDLSPLRGFSGLKSLDCVGGANSKLTDLWPLHGLQLGKLAVGHNQLIEDLQPLKGMPLTYLSTYATNAADLSPLQGMRLESFICGPRVTDLTPLQGMPLKVVLCRGSKIADLSPLKDSPLMHLECNGSRVTDLTPVSKLPLVSLSCNFWLPRDGDLLKGIKTLKTINLKPAAEFWKEAEKEHSGFEGWVQETAKLPVEKQVEAVDKELKKRNPGYKEKFNPHIEKGEVIYFNLHTDQITDIAPLRVFRNVTSMGLFGTQPGKGKLVDIWPLQGVPVVQLGLMHNPITDLRPLADVPGLHTLDIKGTSAPDLSPLQETSVMILKADIDLKRDAAVLRSIKTLKTINDKPAAEVLK